MTEQTSSTNQPLQPGQVVGRFEVRKQVSRDALTISWLAADPDGNEVIIRQLLLGDDQQREALRQRVGEQAANLAKLTRSHPRLVQLIDVVDHPNGLMFVTQHTPGQTLEQHLQQDGSPMDALRALKIVHHLSHVLEAIESQGRVHGSVHPCNILLTDTTGGGVRLDGLGHCSLLGEMEAVSAELARYTAPETLTDGRSDIRSDIYSLGIVAYEMLAGRTAFHDAFRTVIRDDQNQAMRWIKWHTNPHLAAPPLVDIAQQVTPRLSQLIGRMIEKDPAKRITSANELSTAIAHHFGGRPKQSKRRSASSASATATQTAPAGDTAELPKPKRWPWVVVALLIIGGVGAGGFYLKQQAGQAAAFTATVQAYEKSLKQAEQLVQEKQYAEALAALQELGQPPADTDPQLARRQRAGLLTATAFTALDNDQLDEAKTALLELDDMRVISRDTIVSLLDEIQQRQKFDTDLIRIDKAMADRDFRTVRELVRYWHQQTLTPDESAKIAQRRMAMAGQLNEAAISDLLAEAEKFVATGQVEQAIDKLRDGVDKLGSGRLRDRMIELQKQLAYDTFVEQGRDASQANKLPEAIAAYEKAIEIRESPELRQQVRRWQSILALNQGERLMDKGRRAQARTAFLRAVSLNPENHQAAGWVARLSSETKREELIAAGNTAVRQQDFETAVAMFRDAAAIESDDQVETALENARFQLALVQAERALRAGDFDAARDAYRRAATVLPNDESIKAGLSQISDRINYDDYVKQGDRLREQGKFGSAKRAYRQAKEIIDTPEIQTRLDDIEFEHLLTQVRSFMAVGDYNNASAVLRTAAKMRRTPIVEQLFRQIAEEQSQPPTEPADG